MPLRHRLRAAWQAFQHAKHQPHYAVIYDVPIADAFGKCTGDTDENFYESFADPDEAHELFRTAYPDDDRYPTINPRLVMILGPIDDFARRG